MQVICPTCESHYDVSEDIVSAAGRKLKCRECGAIWIQHPMDPANRQASPATAPARARTKRNESLAPNPSVPGERHPVSMPHPTGTRDKIPESDLARRTSIKVRPSPPRPCPPRRTGVEGTPPVRRETSNRTEAPYSGSGIPRTSIQVRPSVAETPPRNRTRLDPHIAGILRSEAKRESAMRAGDLSGHDSDAPQRESVSNSLPESHPHRQSVISRRSQPRRGQPLGSHGTTPLTPDGIYHAPDCNKADKKSPLREEAKSRQPGIGQAVTSPAKAGHVIVAQQHTHSPEAGNGAFLFGLATALLLGCAVYNWSPQIGAHVPFFGPYVEALVMGVDTSGVWLKTLWTWLISQTDHLPL